MSSKTFQRSSLRANLVFRPLQGQLGNDTRIYSSKPCQQLLATELASLKLRQFREQPIVACGRRVCLPSRLYVNVPLMLLTKLWSSAYKLMALLET